VPGACLRGGVGAGLFQLGGGLGADCLGLGFGGLGVGGRGQLAAQDGELVQRGGQLGARAGHRGERVVADRGGPADGGGDRPVLIWLPGQPPAAPERGHRGVPDHDRGAVAAVLGDVLPAAAGPGTRRGRVLAAGRVRASGTPARLGCRAVRRIGGSGRRPVRGRCHQGLSSLPRVPGHAATG